MVCIRKGKSDPRLAGIEDIVAVNFWKKHSPQKVSCESKSPRRAASVADQESAGGQAAGEDERRGMVDEARGRAGESCRAWKRLLDQLRAVE